ncbi:facilitated trehalose transporter Tret1-like isoform X2 [Epargyreus clarus]|uniref:facilitated trehalose transporter Tret1-like isoform X2 n=1 Tax=Epargyreus clarus TaxID=520877 RepID=UPI003C2FD3B6
MLSQMKCLPGYVTSMQVLSSMPIGLILPWLFHKIGRKYTYFIMCLFIFIGYVLFYTSTNVYHVLISQAFLGVSTAASNTFMPVMIAEYTTPKYRGIFLTFKNASTFWGIWISNAIGTYYYWKNIAIVSFVCSVYMLTVLAWPESPTWLAMKGRYTESAKSHRWLKGVNKNSEKELAYLIRLQKKTKTIPLSSNTLNMSCFHTVWTTVTSRHFYKPAVICLLLVSQYQFTGKLIISIYAIEVLKSLTQNESVAYKAMLILDGVTVFSMYMGCIISRYFKRRTIMLIFTSSGISLLYIISLYLYLVALSIIQESHILIILLLTGFSIAIGCGPVILASTIYGEIVPSRYLTSITTLNGFNGTILMSVLLKLSPFMFKTLKMHGSFLLFAISSTVILIILYIILPETKDKTVQEIEEYFSEKQKPLENSQTLLKRKK